MKSKDYQSIDNRVPSISWGRLMLDCMTTYFIVDVAISDQVAYRVKYILMRLLGRISIDEGVLSLQISVNQKC